MKNWFFLFILIPLLSFAQSKETVVESENFSINLPSLWKATNDEGIYNIFPDNKLGAITMSGYENLNLSEEEIKPFILNLYGRNDNIHEIKTKSNKGTLEYHFNFVDTDNNVTWNTKIVKKDQLIYIISISCPTKYWNGPYRNLFLETYNSFKLKK